MPLTRIKSESIDTSGNLDIDSATLFVDAVNNRIGIGTTSPGTKLVIEGGTSEDQFRLGTGSNYYRIGRESSSTGFLTFYGTQPGATGYVFSGVDGERMRITSDGNVGIGVTPSTKLNVGGTGSQEVRITTNTTGDIRIGLDMSGAYYNWIDTYRASGAMAFGIGNTERMRIDSGGNIGIGVAPSISGRRLTIYGSAATAAATSLVLQTSGSGTGAADGFSMELDATNAYLWNYENLPLLFGTNASERARITAAGNFLFGTTSDTSFRMRVVDGNNVAYFGLLTTGRSGGEYPSITHNVEYTTTPASYKYIGTDTAAMIRFNSGKVETLTAASGTSGATISFTIGPYVALGGTTWTAGSSDIRQKKNFEPSQGLAEILEIEPVKFHFNREEDTAPKRLGFKAQNLKSLIPEMVVEKDDLAEDGTPLLTITPDYILPVLVKAIQELKAELDAYKASQ